MKNAKRHFLLWLAIIIPICLAAQGPTEVKNLRTDYLKNPIGIDTQTPHFSWEIHAQDRDVSQTAYLISVSTDAAGNNVIWNSDEVASDKSVNVAYNGPSLEPSTRYYWSVTAWTSGNTMLSSTETAFFETGLMDSGWGNAKWIKKTTLEQGANNDEINLENITDYTISMDFEIKEVAAGPCFSAVDNNNFLMWQINIEKGDTYLRPHSWINGAPTCHEEKNISSLIDIEKNVTYDLRIEISGDKASTYINDILVDENRVNPAGGNYGYGKLGFRSSTGDGELPEQSYFDNVKTTSVIDGTETTLFFEDFSTAQFSFSGGEIENGRLLTSGPDLLAWQSEPVHFTLELDVTLLNDNAGIMFAAQDVNNMFMWSINTYDETYPLLRRHVYINGNPTYEDIPIGSHFSKTDLIDVEHHLTIEVENQEIKTYIDDILIDTHTDNSGRLTNGYVGFRAYNGNNTDEVALYDNVVLTTYKPNNENVIEPVVTFSEDFEEGSNAFEGGETVEIAGNTKLKMYASSSDHRVIQGPMNGIPMFRKTFALDKEIKSAKIYSSSLGAYEMFVNGERVGTENEEGQMVYNELKPGWTDYTKTVQYNSHDITKLLAVGDNAIGAYVTPGWWKGDIAHGKYPNPELCFIAKAVIEYTDGTTTTIATDNSWLSSSSGPIRMAEIYDGITYDARKESNWNKPGYDDSGWFQTAISNRFQGQIIAFVGPHVQVRPEMRQLPESITIYEGSTDNGTTHGAINTVQTVTGNEEIQLNKDQTAVYDMSQNMVGWVKLTAKAAEGTKLTIRFGEMLNDDGSAARGNDGPAGSIYTANLRGARATIDYICKGDPLGETFEPMLTFFGFRYCEISTSEDVTIESFTGEVVGSVNEEGSSMATSNQRVNQLYQNVIWGQRCNFLSIPTDCPQRDERLGWTGDTQIFSRAATYNADVASFFHKWMGDMRDSQRDDGAFPSVAPHSWVGYGQGAWAEAGIIVPWNVYLMYGDTTIVSDNFEAMEKYMEFLANQAGGGYSYNGAGTDYGDWVAYEHTDKRYVSVCYYAYAAQLMEKMSAALSHQEGDAYAQKSTDYQTLYQNIKDEFQVRYVRTDGSLKQTSQTANLLALKLDLFPDEEARENAIAYLNQKIKNNGYKLSTGFVGTGILNQTLSETGSIGMAYNLLLQRGNPSWLYSVDQGATTIWERWDSYTIEDGFQDVGMNSFNHYAYGAVSEWMFRFMAGIEADETKPGFKHIILRPMPDFRINIPNDQERITSVDATYNSYYGPISSSWQQSEEREFTYSVEVPANTTATLYFPIKTDDDNPIFEGEQPAEEAEGVTLVKIEDGKAIFELGSGSYTFKSQIPLKDKAPQVFNGKYIINPNPVKNDLNIGTSPTKYIIKDVSGQELLCGYGVTADVSNLSRGIYLIQVDDEVQKFIKQ